MNLLGHLNRAQPCWTTPCFVSVILLFFITFQSTIIHHVNGQQPSTTPTYTILAPNKLRPNSDYHLTVQVYNTSGQQALVEATISGPSVNGAFNKLTKSVQLDPSETRIVNFEIGEWAKGNYKLQISGHIGPDFKFTNETNLVFESKSYSIFVQTDKAVYKPGQLVRFRAIIVNPSLMPTVAGSLDIYIKVSVVGTSGGLSQALSFL